MWVLGSIFPLHCLGTVHPAPRRGEGFPESRNYFGRLENPMQFIPHILPGRIIRDRLSIWVGAAGVSSSVPQI